MKQPKTPVCAVSLFVRALAALPFLPLFAFADNVLRPGTPVLDRPTLTAIGIKLPVTGDDNYNAAVQVRFRKSGSSAWSNALPLFRVHPEAAGDYIVAPQFSGSIFDLRPATSYDIELKISDPDGPVNSTVAMSGTTRSVPRDPVTARNRYVRNSSELSQALATAQAGDIINLADGLYSGSWYIAASGTQQNPIVIRGASQAGTILDANNCGACNVLEVYGSWVHVERMTLRNALQGLRFQTAGAQGNVLRRVHVKNTKLGMNSRQNQLDFYIADNTFEGRLQWPLTCADDGCVHANDDGIRIEGFGHVVAHNRISGYGDAMKVEQTGARANDFYGNDVIWSYDDGIELDGSEGNARALRNRFTNTYTAISVQPINGGPAYILRNIGVNHSYTPMKFHGTATPRRDPNGVLAYNNTFVVPYESLSMQAVTASHYFELKNNLFVGPRVLRRGVTTDWYAVIDNGTFDYNGYWPDGVFAYLMSWGRVVAPNFAALQTYGVEAHGTLLGASIFASGLVGPASHLTLMAPQDVALASSSSATDRGTVLPNVSDAFTGAAPDLGALETGCPLATYGPRPEGVDETNQPFGCAPAAPVPVAAATTTAVGVPAALTYTSAQQTITLSASVTSSAGPVTAGDVVFLVNGAAAGTVPVSNGSAALSYTVSAGTAAGTQFAFAARYSGTASFAASATATPRTVTVAKASSAVSWANPAAITAGTPLAATQLNASANTAGVFVYTPGAGTVLPAGDGQTLAVSFTPSNANYTTASASVRIDVKPAPAPAPPPTAAALTVGASLIRMGSTQTIVAYITVRNTGSTAVTNLTVSGVRINNTAGSPSPRVVGTINAGASTVLTYSFPNPGPAGMATLYVNGTYNGGQLQSVVPVRLP